MGPESHPENKEFKIPALVFPVLSWLVALYFLIGFLDKSGFPPTFTSATGALGAPALFFLFLPFFNKIKIGKVLELEREVEKAQKELSDFKGEIRSTLSLLSTNVNTIGGMTNQINLTIPGLAELQKA
jgi:amino acid transporter